MQLFVDVGPNLISCIKQQEDLIINKYVIGAIATIMISLTWYASLKIIPSYVYGVARQDLFGIILTSVTSGQNYLRSTGLNNIPYK